MGVSWMRVYYLYKSYEYVIKNRIFMERNLELWGQTGCINKFL